MLFKYIYFVWRSSKFMFTNLQSAQKYRCRVTVLGAGEQVGVRDPAGRQVQKV